MMKKTAIAVIGCGSIANRAHIPAYMKNQDCEILYFCDIIEERAQDAVRQYGCGQAITDYRQVLADERVDALSICTPNRLHSQIAIEALEAGKHVLCEKPTAVTYAQALEMQEAQRRAGRVLNIGVCNRFNRAVNEMKRWIESGRLGGIYHVYISFRAPRSIPGLGGDFTTKAVAGGGVLIDWGVHFLDIVMYCLGDPKTRTVSAQTYSKLGCEIDGYVYENMWAGPPKSGGVYDVEDFATGLIRTEGPTISFNGAWAQNIFEEEMFIDFLGDKAGIRLQYGKDFTVYSTRDGKLVSETPVLESNDHYEAEIDNFLDCIRNGASSPADIDNAIITCRMMQAIYDSSQQGKEIRL